MKMTKKFISRFFKIFSTKFDNLLLYTRICRHLKDNEKIYL